jgi:hypothetical protein
VATQNSIFELNGKAYDALTGAMLGDAARADDTVYVQSMKVRPAGQAAPRASMDGMLSGARRAPSTPKHVRHHQTQPTKTLMRHAVAAPQTAAANTPKPIAVQSNLRPATPAASIAPKLSSTSIDPLRAQRANTAGRSQAVEHFRPQRQALSLDYGRPRPQQPFQAVVASQQPQPVQQQAQPQLQPRPFAQPSLRRAAPAQPQPQARQNEAAYEQDLFSEALAHATSHEQPAPKENIVNTVKRRGKKRKRTLAVVGSVVVFLLLAGVISYQNKANIQLQIASAKAGFSAAAPLYKPAGYKLDKMKYEAGSVSQLYLSKDAQSFTITQKKSNWDSQTLLDNFVATSNEDYQGFQSNGRTIYIYGGRNATWVNGGIWYQIKASGKIPADQLVKIASSI